LSRIAELAQVLVNGSGPINLTHLPLHFGESESHLHAITTFNKIEGSLKKLSGSCHSEILGCFRDL
jgi:hypothetical protein